MIRVIVIGLGLEGLIASWVFRQHPHTDVWLIGHPPLGGENIEDSIITKHTESMGNLLRELAVPHASFSPRDGILLRGEIAQYPDSLRKMTKREAVRIWNIYRAKAALEPMQPNGELKRRSRLRRIRADYTELVQSLADGAQIAPLDEWHVNPGMLHIGRKRWTYDFVVVTSPLWEVHDRFWFPVPDVRGCLTHDALVAPRRGEMFRRWDQVLTPFTPAGSVHEVGMRGAGCVVRSSGPLDQVALLSDLNFLFPAGYELQSIHTDSRGRVQPLARPIRWPENIAPLGVFAEWRSTATLDQVLDGAYDLMRRWL